MKRVAPYFLDEVWREAEQILIKKGRYPEEGGWTIRTTLDPHHQQTAEEYIHKWMPDSGLQVGFMSMEPETGAITSLVGGMDYKESPFNRATQAKRQPGSVMKPILYAAALEDGYNPLTFMSTGRPFSLMTKAARRMSRKTSTANLPAIRFPSRRRWPFRIIFTQSRRSKMSGIKGSIKWRYGLGSMSSSKNPPLLL